MARHIAMTPMMSLALRWCCILPPSAPGLPLVAADVYHFLHLIIYTLFSLMFPCRFL
jgi:hypothetical protein